MKASTATSSDVVVTALSRGPCPNFPELASRYLDEYRQKIGSCLTLVEDEQLWRRPAPGTNSIGNLLLHLAGNLSLWILSGLGGQSFQRDRAGEFSARGGAGKDELFERLETVVERCQGVLRELDGDTLTRQISIQGYETDVQGALFHAVEHMSYHTGQIVWATKRCIEDAKRLDFYPQHRNE